ncbi:phage XkdN-like protein [Gottschalkia purinilytica]|uniref:Phage XkdN-like protein n=1 Tax=Gottschalkia purinilytica TaxID=1503 RepID=A0A0L0WEZ8_GOTPU|nr:hypothetical protein [Gottschalkia purinilytica]KNF10057.1 phage XkdN-like protein [Gottschalkia purinilytica]
MSNVMDLLLKSDVDKIKIPTKKVKIQSLSDSFENDVIFTIQAIPVEVYNSIQESGLEMEDGEVNNVDINKIQILTVLEGVKEPNLKSKELMSHFKAHTPTELLQKMCRPGEITSLYNIINDLCGFGKDAVSEIKNS